MATITEPTKISACRIFINDTELKTPEQDAAAIEDIISRRGWEFLAPFLLNMPVNALHAAPGYSFFTATQTTTEDEINVNR